MEPPFSWVYFCRCNPIATFESNRASTWNFALTNRVTAVTRNILREKSRVSKNFCWYAGEFGAANRATRNLKAIFSRQWRETLLWKLVRETCSCSYFLNLFKYKYMENIYKNFKGWKLLLNWLNLKVLKIFFIFISFICSLITSCLRRI